MCSEINVFFLASACQKELLFYCLYDYKNGIAEKDVRKDVLVIVVLTAQKSH